MAVVDSGGYRHLRGLNICRILEPLSLGQLLYLSFGATTILPYSWSRRKLYEVSRT
jgi:hypothetical protein